jgi:hypothetical protein
MNTSTPEAVANYLKWHADEEEHDAEFLEDCAHRFETVRRPFLRDARIYRERAQNIRASLEALRGITPT